MTAEVQRGPNYHILRFIAEHDVPNKKIWLEPACRKHSTRPRKYVDIEYPVIRLPTDTIVRLSCYQWGNPNEMV